MHAREGFSFSSFIEDSINYQNEEVYIMYGVIFLVLSIICTVYYQHAKYVQRRHSRDGKSE